MNTPETQSGGSLEPVGSETDVAKFALPIPLRDCAAIFRLMVKMHGKGLRMKQEGQWLTLFIPNALAQPQPPGGQAPTKPRSTESPAAAETIKAGGCWLE